MVKNVVAGTIGGIVVCVSAAFIATELRWTRTFAAPFPAIAATTEAATIAHGRYLVFGPAACAYRHVPRDQWTALDAGAMPPLSGNHLFRLPFGEFYAPNLTPDDEDLL